MRRRCVFVVLLALATTGWLCDQAWTQLNQEKLKVGISPFSPFVILSDTRPPAGYAIDLWDEMAQSLGVEYEFLRSNNVVEKLQALKRGETDIAIGGITLTENREEEVDFCHPHFQTGLDILIQHQSSPSATGYLSAFFSGTRLAVFGGFVLMLVIAGHLIWLAERRGSAADQSFSPKYFPGVLEGMYWAIVTASTVGYGDKVPKRWAGRILAGFIIVAALPLFGFFIAQMSSVMTVQELRATISGPQDLWNRRVGVVTETTSEQYMTDIRADVRSYPSIGEAIRALGADQLDAVVYDQPNLLYYAEREGKGQFKVVGKKFEPQDYALAVCQGSPLRELLNRTLLALAESGRLDRLNAKWFGHQGDN